MSNDSNPPVQADILHLWGQIHYTGRQWAEFDLVSTLKPVETFHNQLISLSIQLLGFTLRVSRWLIPRRNSALETLPNEILVEIFRHMGWKDVLASRQTCKHLFEISTARPIWVSFFERLSVELMAPPILESPIDTYTGTELERIVLRRISSEIRWTDTQPPSARKFSVDCNGLDDISLLLEGGRWLLLTSQRLISGRVYAYDLDNFLPPKPQCIIDLGADDPKQDWLMAPDIDQNGSQLTFNLCLVPFCTLDEDLESSVNTPADIQVYRITLHDYGGEATLVAQKTKSLRNGFRALSRKVTLRGHYVARYLQSSEHDLSHIEVLNWFLSDSSTHTRSYIVLEGHTPESLALLPDDKLIVVSNTTIALYDIPNLRSVPAEDFSIESPIQPYWRHTDHKLYSLVHLSKPYVHLHTIRLSVAVKGAVYGLVLSHHSDEDPWYQLISNIDISFTRWASLGINKVYLHWPDGKVEAMSYLWPGSEVQTKHEASLLLNPGTCLRRWDFSYRWSDPPLFDERSCRVFSLTYEGFCVVIDPAFTASDRP